MAVSTYNSTTGVRTVVAGSENGSALDTRLTAVEEKIPSTASSTNQLVDRDSLGTASQKDFTPYVSPDNTGVPISSSVYSAITSAVYGAYHPSGSKTIAELTSDLLVLVNIGNVYKITEDGVTTDLFIGGAGQTIHTGDNAVVVYGGSPNTFLFDLQSGSIDLTPYQTKALESAIEGETTVEGALSALSSDKVSTDLVPTDASASNKLVTANGKADRINTAHWISDDFNNAIPADESSFKIFTVLNSAGHTPATGANYIVIAQAFDGNNIQQEAIQNQTNNRYIRYYNGSSWSNWQKLVTKSDISVIGQIYSTTTLTETSVPATTETTILRVSNLPLGTYVATGSIYGSSTLNNTGGIIQLRATGNQNSANTVQNSGFLLSGSVNNILQVTNTSNVVDVTLYCTNAQTVSNGKLMIVRIA